jgi:multidrug efflux pump subunit AcrB
MVPLGTLISYKPTEAPPLVSHFNIFRTAEIDGSAADGYSSGEALISIGRVSG